MIVRKNHDLAGLDLDRLPLRDLCGQAPLDDIVIEHDVLGTFEQRAAVLAGDLRGDAPGRRELRMEKHPALQTNDPQYVRQRIHSGGLSTLRAPPAAVRRTGRLSTASQGEIKLLSKLSAVGAGMFGPFGPHPAEVQPVDLGVSDKTAGVPIIGEIDVCGQIRPRSERTNNRGLSSHTARSARHKRDLTEMNMSTMSSAPNAPQEMAGQSSARDLVKDLVKNLGATLIRWCVAYLTWRIERAAITQLGSMSDRQLRDIGISRSEIMGAVRGEVDGPLRTAQTEQALSGSIPGSFIRNPRIRREKMIAPSKNPETLVLHAGPRNDGATGAVAVPIVQTTSYQFRNTEHAANLFGLKEFGNIYSRIMNPTCDALEQRMAALEGGVAALAVSSGQAASAMALQNLCRPGDNVVSSTDLYGGTWNLFANTLPSMGITVRFADPADPEAFRRATDERTRAYYAETLPNPKLTVFPIGEVAAIGRELGVPLIMDNTAAPVICRPLDHGAAIVVHSTTKYVGGHGTSIGGIIVDGGNFDWSAHKRALPDAQRTRSQLPRCGLDRSGETAGADRLHHPSQGRAAARHRFMHEPLQRIPVHPGAGDSPAQDARALPQCGGGRAPSAAPSPRHARHLPRLARRCRAEPRAATYLRGGLGGLVGFELKQGREAGARFIDALKLFYHVANIGDARSLAIHPASTTHSQLSPADQLASGVTPGYVRLSVGIEHIDDIIADLDQALAAATAPMAEAA